jgi:hypothetical protein
MRISGLINMAVAMALLSTTVHASSVWDKTITHPLSGGRLLAGDRCHFATTNCAGTGTHLGVDVMAAGGTQVVAMCPGTVKHNNTATASIWNSKVIVEHNCGAQFQKIYGYYGHVASDLAVDAFIESGAAIGTLKGRWCQQPPPHGGELLLPGVRMGVWQFHHQLAGLSKHRLPPNRQANLEQSVGRCGCALYLERSPQRNQLPHCD